MSQDTAADDTLTSTELSEMIAEMTGTTAGEIEHAASDLDIAPPDEATVIEE